MNILPSSKDPLKNLISTELSEKTFSPTTSKVKDVFNFLKWKQMKLPEQFSQNDNIIINSNQLFKFGDLSQAACSYTKPLMKNYTELTWQAVTNSQYQLEGCSEVPRISFSKIKFPPHTSRLIETLTLSMFYPNNLLLGFLNRYDPLKFPENCCMCGNGIQDTMHLLLNCRMIHVDKRSCIERFLKSDPFHTISSIADQKSLLLSWSRVPGFLEACCSAIQDVSDQLLSEVII